MVCSTPHSECVHPIVPCTQTPPPYVCVMFLHSGVKMEWCNDGDLLAVTGFIRMPNLDCANDLRFYTVDGHLRYSRPIPHQVSNTRTIIT